MADVEQARCVGAVGARGAQGALDHIDLHGAPGLFQGEVLGAAQAAGLAQRYHVLRKLCERDLLPIGQDRGPLDHVLELAHVARPGVGDQALERLVGHLESDETPLDEKTEKRVKSWVYDLTRQKIAHRVRAERRLTALGSPVIPHVLPIVNHPSELTRIAAFRIFKNVAKVGDERVIVPCLEALDDEKRFVRKMAWETLRKVSKKRFRFPWDDDNTERQRVRASKRWEAWWEKEQKRRDAAAESEKAVREGAGFDDDR